MEIFRAQKKHRMPGDRQTSVGGIYRALAVFSCVALLSGCLSQAPAPVINKSPNRKIPVERVVKPGESIYAISWQYGIDFLDIAKWNNIKPPYRLQSGRSLVLRPGAKAPASASGGVVVKTLPQETIAPTTLGSPLPAEAPAQTQPVAAAPSSQNSQPARKPSTNLPALSSPGRWQWPAQGKVIAKYSPKSGVNGIRIAAAPGTAVRASAAGDVVYVGEGLRGYGKLIIVKHSTEFLSAYAHNRRILVAEGERVKSSQQIAEMGDSGASSTMLHFEIRVNGKPEDPLKYLR